MMGQKQSQCNISNGEVNYGASLSHGKEKGSENPSQTDKYRPTIKSLQTLNVQDYVSANHSIHCKQLQGSMNREPAQEKRTLHKSHSESDAVDENDKNTIADFCESRSAAGSVFGGLQLSSGDHAITKKDSYLISMEEILPKTGSYIEERKTMKTADSDTEHDKPTTHPYSIERFSSMRSNKDEYKGLPKRIKRYYKYQDELIDAYENFHFDVADAMDIAQEKSEQQRKTVLLARVSFGCNLVLFVAKTVAAVLSGSLAVISSVIDSAVDLVSGALMWWSNRAIAKRNIYEYPEGRTKLEPVAIVILSVVMALASVQMIIQSVQKIIKLATNDKASGPDFGVSSIVICCVTIVTKLILFLVCRRVPTPSTQVLSQDHRNDVLSNSVALACGLLGDKVWSYVDPIGAILISFYIIFSWSKTGLEQVKMLTGHTARPDFLKKITWLAVSHDAAIQKIETVRAFHFGNNFLVEVHLVLPEDMSLKQSHDIGETLQMKIEHLPEVERAFVHLDYDAEHDPEEEHKVV